MKRLKLQLFLGAVVSMTAVVAVVEAVAPDARLALCGEGFAGNRATLSFEIPDVGRVWDHLPAMKMAPELAAKSGPGFVVLFDRYEGLGMNGPISATNVVCVVDAAGHTMVLANVARDGLRVP